MQGLRTRENEKFMRFFELVQKEAEKLGKVFFLDFGQCDDIQFKDMEVDTLFGWLIPKENANDFEKVFLNGEILKPWDQYCSWVIPEIVGENIDIQFE